MDNWIMCSEKLPTEKDKDVIIALDNGKVTFGTYSEFNNTWYIGSMSAVSKEKVIAWSKLPKHPNK